jgi:predicted short-subunit dehydrogenase-like oxidoreductase (DUF2520 family)
MQSPSYKITLIGSGNVATQLGKALQQAGHKIVQVFSRTPAHAQELATQLGTQHTTSLEDLLPGDIYLFAVKDDVLEEIASQLKIEGIAAHTSGSMAMDVLSRTSRHYGAFYPLQTFSKGNELDLKEVPFCIEASDDETKEKLSALAGSLGSNTHYLDSEQRRVLHLAAVFACNFTNHMYALAEDVLTKKNIPFDILLPLIEETASKVKNTSPRKAQTGPAKRNDLAIMARHLEMLQDQETAQALYKLISFSIQQSS